MIKTFDCEFSLAIHEDNTKTLYIDGVIYTDSIEAVIREKIREFKKFLQN